VFLLSTLARLWLSDLGDELSKFKAAAVKLEKLLRPSRFLLLVGSRRCFDRGRRLALMTRVSRLKGPGFKAISLE
jgi:hypothetical protein